jgi:hypothetical protein
VAGGGTQEQVESEQWRFLRSSCSRERAVTGIWRQKTRAMVVASPEDIAAPRLIELAERLEADAAADERKAHALLEKAQTK